MNCPGPAAHRKAKQNNNQIMGLLSNHTSKIRTTELKKCFVLDVYDSIQLSTHGFSPGLCKFTYFSSWGLSQDNTDGLGSSATHVFFTSLNHEPSSSSREQSYQSHCNLFVLYFSVEKKKTTLVSHLEEDTCSWHVTPIAGAREWQLQMNYLLSVSESSTISTVW